MLTMQFALLIIFTSTKVDNQRKEASMEKIKKIVDRDKLKVEMLKKKMTQEEVAQMLGISRASLSSKMIYRSEFDEAQLYVLYKNFGPSIFLK